jgi:hypothetical protein
MNDNLSKKKPLELNDIYAIKPVRFDNFGRPSPAFGQIWTVGNLDKWLPASRELPLNIPVVIINPESHAGLLRTCTVVGLHELRSFAASDDIFCRDEDKLPESSTIALWLSCDLFPRHLDQCIGFLSNSTASLLKRKIAGEKINDPLREFSGGPIITDADSRIDYRSFMTKQFGAFSQPVKHYLEIWKKLNETLASLDVREAEESIALNCEIEKLIDSGTFSEDFKSLILRAGEESFKNVGIEAIEEQLKRIDSQMGAGTPDALRGRLAFLHKCFEDSLKPEILARLEREIHEHHPTG